MVEIEMEGSGLCIIAVFTSQSLFLIENAFLQYSLLKYI